MATAGKSERVRTLYGGPPKTSRITINRMPSESNRLERVQYSTVVNHQISHSSSEKSMQSYQKAISEPGVVQRKPPRAPTEGYFNVHIKHRGTPVDHANSGEYHSDLERNFKRSTDSLHTLRESESSRRLFNETRRSAENLMPRKPAYTRKLRSMSPTKKPSQLFPSRSMTNVNEYLTVKLPDGRMCILDELDHKSIGMVLKDYMRTIENPVECVDSSTDHVIPWKTASRELSGRSLYIREIGGLASSVVSPTSQSGRRLEKRVSNRMDNWFSYIASTIHEENTLADKYEESCLRENPPSNTPPLRRASKHGKWDREVKPVSGAEMDGIYHTATPDSPRLSGSNPRLDRPSMVYREADYRNRLFSIKSTWEDIVKPTRELTKKEIKKQAAIWEVFVTELNYINDIRCILNNYIAPFRHHNKLFLNLEPAQIFSNLEQVYQANIRLWLGYLHKAYRKVSESGDLLTADLLEPGFLQIPQLFWPYQKYCQDLPRCQKYVKHAKSTNATFAAFLEWADKTCPEQREPLWDQLAKPFKRITKYPLMLSNIQQYCDDPGEVDCITRVLGQVKAFVRTIDSSLGYSEPRDQMDRLVDQLMFPDYNENPGDCYQYFYDHFRRSSLLEDIELPAPVVLTVSDIRAIHDSHVLEDLEATSINTQPRRASDFADQYSPWFNSDASFLQSPMNNPNTPRSSIFNLSDHSTAPRDRVKRISSVRSSASFDVEQESVNVQLYKWIPPKGYNTSKLSPTILDRIRSANIPSGLRRTVPRKLLFQGPLRFRERQGKWSDVTCFLLTDQLLITKTYKRENGDVKFRFKVCRTPIRLDKLAINKLKDNDGFTCAVLDDFHMIIQLFTFLTPMNNGEEWCSQLCKAKANYLQLMRPEILVAARMPSGELPYSLESSCSGLGDPYLKSAGSRQTLLSLARLNSDVRVNSPGIGYVNTLRPSSSASMIDQRVKVRDTRFRPHLNNNQASNKRSSRPRTTASRRPPPAQDRIIPNSNKYSLGRMEESAVNFEEHGSEYNQFKTVDAHVTNQSAVRQGGHVQRSKNSSYSFENDTKTNVSPFSKLNSVNDVFSWYHQPTISVSMEQLPDTKPVMNGMRLMHSGSFSNDSTPKQFRNSICRAKGSSGDVDSYRRFLENSEMNNAHKNPGVKQENRASLSVLNLAADRHVSTRL